MSEYPFDKPPRLVAGEVNWAFDPADGSDTVGPVDSEPNPSRRLNGWNPNLPEKPAAQHLNYALRESTKAATWLAATAIRHFDGLAEAIQATEPGDLFMIRRTVPAIAGFANVRTLGSEITALACDGERLYVATDDGPIVCLSVDDPGGDPLWSVDPFGGFPCGALAADGQAVFALTGHGSVPTNNIRRLNRDTGATTHSLTGEVTTTPSVASNGVYAVWKSGSAGRGIVRVDAADLGNITQNTTAWHASTGTIRQVAITHEFVLAAGTYNGGASMCRKLSDLTLGGNLFYDSAGSGDSLCVATDGVMAYMGGTTVPVGGLDTTMQALGVYGGEFAWRELGGDGGTGSVAVCGRFVCAQHEYTIAIHDKIHGRKIFTSDTYEANGRQIVTDGFRFWIGVDADLVRLDTPGVHRVFQRVAGTDSTRFMHTLAIPLEGR